MKIKIISTVFAITALASFSMPGYSNSLCASAERNAVLAQADFVTAGTARAQACSSDPNSNLCAIAATVELQSGNYAANALASALTCRIFWSIE